MLTRRFRDAGPLVGFLPLYHMYGCLWLMFHAARHHQKTVIFPGFIPDAILQVIQDYKVTMLHSVPPVVLFLAQSPMVEKYDLSSLKYVMCGGKRIPLYRLCRNHYACQSDKSGRPP